MATFRPGPPRKPCLAQHEVVSGRIHPSLDGLRIAHLSDIHVRSGVRPRQLHRAVDLVNALAPDLVVLTGDYVCFSARPAYMLTDALRHLRAPAFATLGNHDHWSGAAQVSAALEKAGVDVLRNEHRVVTMGTSRLHLVGVDDSVTRNHDPERAFRGVPDDATRVVLAHDPGFADSLAPYRPALVLSGHTHGGQIYFRRLTPYLSRRIGMKYLAGFFEIDGAVLYVNRGLGASVPVRLGAPSEVAHLTLRSAVAQPAAVCAA
jgi:uncharacterized protein